jgi:hypothetical protein
MTRSLLSRKPPNLAHGPGVVNERARLLCLALKFGYRVDGERSPTIDVQTLHRCK